MFSGAISGIMMPVYLIESLEFSISEIGLIFALSGIIRAFITPMIGYYIDKHQKLKLSLALAILVNSLVMIFIFTTMTNIAIAVIAYVVFYISSTIIGNLIDRFTNEYANHHKTSYGEYKVFGSASYTLVGFLIPFAMVLGYSKQAIIITGLINLSILTLLKSLPILTVQKKPEMMSKTSWFTNYKKVWILILAYQIVFSGASNVAYYYVSTYLNLFNVVALTSIAIIFGSCLSEIPSFLKYKTIVNKFGEKKVIIFVLIVTNIRWILNILFPGPIMYIFTMLLHGLLFAITWSYTLDIITEYVKPSERTIVLTIMSSLSFCIAGISQGIAAIFLDNANLTGYFTYLWIVTIIGTILYIIWFNTKQQGEFNGNITIKKCR